MTSYRFENKQFILSSSETSSLHCLSFSDVRDYQAQFEKGSIAELTNNSTFKLFEKEQHLSHLAEIILTAKNDAFINHYSGCVLLSLTLKNHLDSERNEPIIMIYYQRYMILVYDDSLSDIDHYIENINEVFSLLTEIPDPNYLVPYALIRDDLAEDRVFLRDIESMTLEFELSFGTQAQDSHNTILNLRKTLSGYKHYYLSLIDLLEDMTEDYESFLPPEIGLNYQRLISKVNRLYKYSVMLGEYVSQVNDRYRAQLDLNLNKTMKTFTILSAIFLPLTLIVGWYGMNFEGMPELSIKYGYLYVIGLSLTILLGSLFYIHKRGFWD